MIIVLEQIEQAMREECELNPIFTHRSRHINREEVEIYKGDPVTLSYSQPLIKSIVLPLVKYK